MGAGVIGLSVATHLLESYHSDLVVTVIADKFTPDTTASDKSGGIILIGTAVFSEYPKTLALWKSASLNHFSKLYNLEKDGVNVRESNGITYASGACAKPQNQKGPAWYKDLFPNNYQDVRSEQSELARCSTYLVNPSEYMSYLTIKIRQLGGLFVQKKVESLSELNSFDVVINCTGLGARELACDSAMYPTKGVLVSVRAPWVKEWYNEAGTHDGRSYIFPRVNEVILGGCNEVNREDLMIDYNQVQQIIDRCVKKVPSLANADVLKVLVGVRPMRKGGVRLEKESINNDTTVIHNYGHGSYGITLSWGCAEAVGDIVGQTLGIVKKPLIQSKL